MIQASSFAESPGVGSGDFGVAENRHVADSIEMGPPAAATNFPFGEEI
jgi:hypothetical protein